MLSWDRKNNIGHHSPCLSWAWRWGLFQRWQPFLQSLN